MASIIYQQVISDNPYTIQVKYDTGKVVNSHYTAADIWKPISLGSSSSVVVNYEMSNEGNVRIVPTKQKGVHTCDALNLKKIENRGGADVVVLFDEGKKHIMNVEMLYAKIFP